MIDSVTIMNNEIVGVNGKGGGIYLINSDGFQSTPVIKDLVIKDNTAPKGGGIYLFHVNPIIERIQVV